METHPEYSWRERKKRVVPREICVVRLERGKLKNSSIKEKMEKAKHQTKQNVHIYEAKKSAKDRQ